MIAHYILIGGVIIISYDAIKIHGLEKFNIDYSKSELKQCSDQTTISLYLNKNDVKCPECNSINYKTIRTKSSRVRTTSGPINVVSIIFNKRFFMCKTCGCKFHEINPFSEQNKQISEIKKLKMVIDLKNRNETYESIANKHKISSTHLEYIFDSYVDISRHKLTTVMCFDEIYAKRVTSNKYCFIMLDPTTKTIIDILNCRKKDFLMDYFDKIPVNEKNHVMFISIDMWDSYAQIIKKTFPNAIICIDSFHVIKNITDKFDLIRKDIMKKYANLGKTDNPSYWLLKKFNWVLLKDSSKLKQERFYMRKLKRYMSEYEILVEILKLDSLLAKAYSLLQEYKDFNSIAVGDQQDANTLDKFISEFLSFGGKYSDVGRMLRKWRKEILNSFTRIDGKRINNGYIERANSEIKLMFKRSHGTTNFNRTRNRVMFAFNKNEPIQAVPKAYGQNKRTMKKRGNYKK